MTRADLPPDDVPPDETEAAEALEWMRRSRAQARVISAVGKKVRHRRSRGVAVVSAGLLAALAVGLFWRDQPRIVSPAALSPTVIVTAPSRETLPDGSMVELKGDARITVEFESSLRRVRLLHGEAHFQVAKDAGRPFVVAAAGVEVFAVGTAFSVQVAAGAVDVLVTEGRVAVEQGAGRREQGEGEMEREQHTPGDTLQSQSSTADFRPPTSDLRLPSSGVFVDAGNRIKVDLGSQSGMSPTITAVPPADITERLSWRVPQLEFARTPLPEAVEIMNRHAAGSGQVRFVIDPESRELWEVKLNGFLRADNAAGLVYLLEAHSGVRAERRGDSEIILRKAR